MRFSLALSICTWWNILISPFLSGAVLFDAVGPSSAGSSSLTWSHTNSGANRLLIVAIACSNDATATATYNGVSMSSVAKRTSNNDVGAGFAQMFSLIAPSTGANTVSISITVGSCVTFEGGSVSFTSVNQTTPISNTNTAFGNSTPASVTVTSAVGNMTIDVACGGHTFTASNTTNRWRLNINNDSGAGNAAQSTAAGSASVTMTETLDVSEAWGIIGTNINALALVSRLPILGIPFFIWPTIQLGGFSK